MIFMNVSIRKNCNKNKIGLVLFLIGIGLDVGELYNFVPDLN